MLLGVRGAGREARATAGQETGATRARRGLVCGGRGRGGRSVTRSWNGSGSRGCWMVLRQRMNVNDQVPDFGVVGATCVFGRHLISYAVANGSEEIAVGLAGKGAGVGPILECDVHGVLAVASVAMAKSAIAAIKHLGP